MTLARGGRYCGADGPSAVMVKVIDATFDGIIGVPSMTRTWKVKVPVVIGAPVTVNFATAPLTTLV